MNIKDYLHFHYGCPCLYRYGPTGEWKQGTIKEIALQRVRHGAPYEVKPILRPLDSITSDECREQEALQTNYGEVGCGCIGTLRMDNGKSIAYLLSKHFDLFGLIESGMAIEATTIPSTQKEVL